MYKAAMILIACFLSSVYACTDFKLSAADGTILITRSMEFSIPFHSNLRTSNRGRIFYTNGNLNRPGLSWTAKYGYVYLDGLNTDVVIDGMNEKGLTFEALYLPGITQYQVVPTNHSKLSLAYFNLGDWILSNFDSVEDIKKQLPKIFIYAGKLPQFGEMIFPLHFSVYDARGKGIVIEYINGQLNIHDNKIGVLTNSPAYHWHLTNLVNYIHLTPENPLPIIEDKVTFAATGQGFGMVGIPGDISPPSRFVKIATMLRVVLTPKNASELVNLAEHIINNVDIPLGLVRESNKGTYVNESTQWVVFKDVSHLIFYYRTYDNLTLRSVDLKLLKFDVTAHRLKMPIENTSILVDKTKDFLESH